VIQATTTLIVLWSGELIMSKGADGNIFGLSFSNLGFSIIQAGVAGFVYGMLIQNAYAERYDPRDRVLQRTNRELGIDLD